MKNVCVHVGFLCWLSKDLSVWELSELGHLQTDLMMCQVSGTLNPILIN